ncbi:MAG: penicillin-binding protein activator [Deltaproteobacteria bacterium]|nr:penicillin-binding protein activator [Deltaproteobacteria bacterium]
MEKALPVEIEHARTLVSNGDVAGGRNAYESFIISHPGTVEADLARLELGILEAASSGCARATLHFQQAQDSPDRAIALRASLRYAACQLDSKQPDEALETLDPLAGERFADAEQELLWKTAVGASEQTLNAPLALHVMDALLEKGGTPPDPERASAAIDVLVMKLAIEQAAVLFDELRLGAAPQLAVARRMLEHGLETQDADLVAMSTDALRQSTAVEDPEVRMLVARGDEFLHGNPYLLGALLPLSGRGREVGRQLLQGMQLAALHEGGPELIVEDTAGDPSNTTAAVESLIGDQRVVAVLGPVGTRTIAAAAESTRRAGVPLLTFSAAEGATGEGDQVFRFLYSPRDEVRALVRKARARGASRYVILHPDHGYGRMLRRTFDEEVAAAGGSTCEGVAYPPGTRSFVDYVKALLEEECNVVLLADVAEQVASIAPTFAAEDAWSARAGRLPGHAEREVHFLLPSPSWSSKLLARASRYLQGALVVVPFYGESEAPTNVDFRKAYEERYGRPPETFAAYGYDAYRMISATLRQGYQTREALAEALRAGTGVTAVTSMDRFSPERTPAHAPRVYEVRGTVLELQE